MTGGLAGIEVFMRSGCIWWMVFPSAGLRPSR